MTVAFFIIRIINYCTLQFLIVFFWLFRLKLDFFRHAQGCHSSATNFSTFCFFYLSYFLFRIDVLTLSYRRHHVFFLSVIQRINEAEELASDEHANRTIAASITRYFKSFSLSFSIDCEVKIPKVSATIALVSLFQGFRLLSASVLFHFPFKFQRKNYIPFSLFNTFNFFVRCSW